MSMTSYIQHKLIAIYKYLRLNPSILLIFDNYIIYTMYIQEYHLSNFVVKYLFMP